MKKLKSARFVLIIHILLIAVMLLSACNTKESRLPAPYVYNPGGAFTANIKDEDPRRTIKCAVVFEVIDEAAVTELAAYNFAIRNAVLIALGELTLEELTVNRDLKDVSQRLVTQVNSALTRSHIDLIVGAYFTDFIVA